MQQIKKIIPALLLLGLIGTTFSCKKLVEPTLIITAVDTAGTPIPEARIYTSPCFDPEDCDHDRLNPNFGKEGVTDNNGEVRWTYPHSAVIEIKGDYTECDTAGVGYTPWCFAYGDAVAKFDAKYLKKDEKNEYNVTIELVYQE